MLTVAPHGDHDLLQVRPLSVCAIADTDVDCWLVVATGFVLLCNQGGGVGDGEAREAAHHENVSFFRQQGAHYIWAQAVRFILNTLSKSVS